MRSGRSAPRSALLLALLIAAGPVFAQAPGNVPSAKQCLIKGNVSSMGERIYHPPGCRYYNATVIDPNRGERWFCSEADAVAAGWRRTKVC